MLTNIDIDEVIAQEAMKLSGAKTKRELVDRALREMVARAKRPSIRELFGMGGIAPDYDPKAPWARGAESGQHRVEEPRTVYAVTRTVDLAPIKPKKTPRAQAKTKITAPASNSVSKSFVNAKAKRRQYKSTASEADKVHG